MNTRNCDVLFPSIFDFFRNYLEIILYYYDVYIKVNKIFYNGISLTPCSLSFMLIKLLKLFNILFLKEIFKGVIHEIGYKIRF